MMWLDRVIKSLLPREEHFFDLLERGADCALQSANVLSECCTARSASERQALVSRITDIEHAADAVIRDVYDALNKTFVTPLDRSDIYALATDLENVSDRVHSTMMRVVVHAMEDLPPASQVLAAKILEGCSEIHSAVKLLRGMKRVAEINRHCKAIAKLEHDGDQIFRSAIVELFNTEKDAIHLIKHKEFLEGLENTLDACDDVANALEALVIKNA
ncbi:DUF47 domain-containing protein [Sorangium sp. KYC3313]|uniref:DUF47 domain-containing protein n=1 Tax=Sorangium sp. KYC3313 TaxID=3449740 RepID=UPI003F898F2A